MRNLLLSMKEKLTKKKAPQVDENFEEYIEVGHGADNGRSILTVRPYSITDFEDIKDIINHLREGYTIALINIRPLKEKDIVELKRAINKLKKTCDAIDGDVAGFGDDYIVAVPNTARIYRSSQQAQTSREGAQELEE